MNNEIPDGCLPFDLDLALKGWPACTKDGEEVKITHFKDSWVKCERWIDTKNPHDLFLKKKTRTYWYNVYKTLSKFYLGNLYLSHDDAKNSTVDEPGTYYGTFYIDLDEPEEKPNCNDIGKGHGFGLSTGICIECGVQQKKTKTLWVAICKKPYEKDDYGTSCAYSDRHVIDKNLTSDNYWIKSVEVECE